MADTPTDHDADDAPQVENLARPSAGASAGVGGLVHRRRCVRSGWHLHRRRRAPPRSGRHRAATFHGRAERDGRDRSHAARPPSSVHGRARARGVAEGVRVHEAGPSRGRHRRVQEGIGDEGTSCARVRIGAGQPRETWPSRCSTARWRRDTRPTSASPARGGARGRGRYARLSASCTTVTPGRAGGLDAADPACFPSPRPCSVPGPGRGDLAAHLGKRADGG